MGRRKIAQKNTLALWAGVKSEEKVSSTVLHFKIDVEKLKRCQVTRSNSSLSCSTLVDGGNEVTEATSIGSETSKSTELASEATTTKPIVDPHPFFSRPKKQSHLQTTLAPDSVSDSPSYGPQPETHSFFKPRIPSKENISQTSLPVVSSLRSWPTPMPSKDSMNVTGVNDSDIYKTDGSHGRIHRKTRRHLSNSNGSNNISDPWQKLLPLAKADLPTPRVMPAACDRIIETNAEFWPTSRDHGALRGLANRRHCQDGDKQQDRSSLWCAKYAPCCAAEVLQKGKEAYILRDWLQTRRLQMTLRLNVATKRSGGTLDKYADLNDDFIVDDDVAQPLTSDIGAEFDDEQECPACPTGRESLWKSNLIILCGPSGCGKSAAIQAAATELNFEIFEVNPTDRRSSKDILERVGEASLSQMVNKQKSADGTQSKSLLLFEEADVLYRDDKDFWSGILALVTTSKRPVVLTCNDESVIAAQFRLPAIFVRFEAPPEQLVVDYLTGIMYLEQRSMSRTDIREAVVRSNGDLRASINRVQFQSLGSTTIQEDYEDNIGQELMSQQLSITSLYESAHLEDPCRTALPRASFQRYQAFVESVSLIDTLANQQRSLALEDPDVFENETEEFQARAAHKDDLIGLPMISDPYGRFTRLHPGDRGLPAEIAIAVQKNLSSEIRSAFPFWVISTIDLHRTPLLERYKLQEQDYWNEITEICESLACPDHWMQDYAPHNSIDRPRVSGILASEISPYLREMCRVEEERDVIERAALAAHGGRMTRNTISNELGVAYKRPTRIQSDLRKEILSTGFKGAQL